MFEHAYTFWVLLRDERFGTITLRLEFDGGKSQDQSVASPERWVNIRIQTTSLKTIEERLAATLTGGASELYASMALCSVRVVGAFDRVHTAIGFGEQLFCVVAVLRIECLTNAD